MGIKILDGKHKHNNYTLGVVVSRWNSFITEKLKDGAVEALKKHGIPEEQITVAYCPGAYEIPLTAKTLLETGRYDGVICLGAVIRGDTPHFDFVCDAVNYGVTNLNISQGKPVTFGVLTTNNVEQALERTNPETGNKGEEAAVALLEMLSLMAKIKQ